MDALIVDQEFQRLIPPLADEEKRQLEENILKDGCRDPLVTWNGIIIDGHNRYEICTRNNKPYKTVNKQFGSKDDAKIWIIENQFGRRNLAPYTIGELTLKLEPLIAKKAKANQVASGVEYGKGCQKSDNPIIPIDTKKELAKATGGRLSHDTIAKVKLIDKHADEETKAKLRNNEVSIHRVAKDIKETRQKEERKEQRKEAASKTEPQFFDNIHVGDFRDHAGKIADGSLSLIFTDPPYDREAIKLFPDLAKFAESKLCEGGSMLCYVGHIQLPDAFKAFSEHLRYWWTVCCLHSGGNSLMKEYGIRVGWKAVLWFVKGTRDNKSDIVLDVMSGGKEKTHHDWQQAQSEAEYWIDHLCPSDGVVCDPFLGGGTTAAAAIKLNRKWVAFEKDHDQAVLAMARCKK